MSTVTYGIAVSFQNPMDCFLTECELIVDGTIVKHRLFINGVRYGDKEGEIK